MMKKILCITLALVMLINTTRQTGGLLRGYKPRY